MNTGRTHGRDQSLLGEHLVAILVLTMVVLALAASIPAVVTQTGGSAARAEERANLPLAVAKSLEQRP